MSTLRPELRSGSTKPCMRNGTAYMMILTAVEQQPSLVHGQLHRWGAHCAIGSYFSINDATSLEETLIDEVAAVNDSVPHMNGADRKAHVARWLRWKLQTLGMPLTVAPLVRKKVAAKKKAAMKVKTSG